MRSGEGLMRAWSTRWKVIAAAAVLLASMRAGTEAPLVTPSAVAQEATGWVAVQIYQCPSGMTSATLDPWSCWVVTDGVEAQLWAGDGTPLLGFGDAYFDGWTWTWQWLAVGSPEAPISYHIVQTAPPAGAIHAMVQYAPAEGDASTVWLSSPAAGADVHVYNFFP
jgi:hypothetical protein